jgi:DNA repair protein SbcD/Mre11
VATVKVSQSRDISTDEMRIIHFSDTHLGFAESSKIDPQTGVNQREQDAYTAFKTVIDKVLQGKPEMVIHAGDLFHSPRPPNRAIVTALVGFQRLSVAGIPVILVAGNHSVPRVATTGSLFEALRIFPGVRSAYGGRYEVFEVGEVAVHCVPHMATEDMLQAALAQVKVQRAKRFNILVMHGGVRGTGEQFSLGEFNELAISKDVLLRFSEFDYVALGHYHKHMQVGVNAWYSGSTERFHSREAGYKKGYIEVDLVKQDVTFHQIPTREMLTLPVIVCRALSLPEIITAIESALKRAQPLNDKIVYVRLTEVDPTTWVELQRERRSIEREYAADAFEVRWDRTFAEPKEGKSRRSMIGSLAMEFAAFMKTTKVEDLNRDRLRKLGERLISEALEAEAAE